MFWNVGNEPPTYAATTQKNEDATYTTNIVRIPSTCVE